MNIQCTVVKSSLEIAGLEKNSIPACPLEKLFSCLAFPRSLNCMLLPGYVYGVASQKRYIGQVHRFGALCTAPNSVHWCTEFGALVHRI